MPTVSVVIPTRNRARFLREALGSVVKQDFADFEVLVVDDGSTDDTGVVPSSLGDPRVSYIHQENAGRSAARNRGIAVARGRYLAFLDDDDTYLPTKLGRQVRFLEEHPEVDVLGGSAWLTDSVGAIRGNWPGIEAEIELDLAAALYSCPLMPTTAMVRRDAADALGVPFDGRLEPFEDKDFFLRLLLNGSRAVVSLEEDACYRVHENNSQRDAPHNTRQHLRSLEKILQDPRAPDSIKESSDRVRAMGYLDGALQAYATGHLADAGAFLREALRLDPGLGTGAVPDVARQAAGFARTFHVTDPGRFLDLVFDELPDDLSYLSRYRGAARGAYYFEGVFRDHRAGRLPSLRHWVLGGVSDPRWILNRGVWSILVRDIIGGRVIRRHRADGKVAPANYSR